MPTTIAVNKTREARTAEVTEALETLRGWLKPGDTVYTILRNVSRSGMQRTIQLVKINDDMGPDHQYSANRVLHIGWNAAKVLGLRYDTEREGVVVGGAGMDMGFHLVYELGRALWPQGFGCVGERCPSNDHTNGDRDYTAHTATAERCGIVHWHNDGGYALTRRWL